jgi:hypothetical protein
MNERDMAEKNKILLCKVGSQLYGTNTETSDVDYVGIFMPTDDFILGLRTVEQVDFSKVSKGDDGRNTKDAIDRVIYEYRKFVKLAMENNPNIIELLFVNPENILFINSYGKTLLGNYSLFPYKGLTGRFIGYAHSQKHKMIIKTDHYHQLQAYNEYLMDVGELITMGELRYYSIGKDLKFSDHHVTIGDLNIPVTSYVKKARKMITERLSKAGNRKELITKFGYDTKFASHLIRLLLEGKELLDTGMLHFPLKERQMLLDIKGGKHSIKFILDLADSLEKEVESSRDNCKLPNTPRFDEINNLCKKQMRRWIEEIKDDY